MWKDIDRMSEEEREEEMRKILAQIDAEPDSVNWEPPKDLHDKVLAEIRKREDEKIREQLSEEDRELLRYGQIYKRQLKHQKYWVFVAVLVMTLAVGMTSIGGPERLVQMMTRGLSGREQALIDTDDGSVSDTEGWSEEEAYEEIEEKYGLYPVKLIYLPEGVAFREALLWDEVQGIQLLYEKNEKLSIEYFIRPNYQVGSVAVDMEDESLMKYDFKQGNVLIEVEQYRVKENGEIRWEASFVHNKTYYLIVAHDSLQQVEFEQILSSLMIR